MTMTETRPNPETPTHDERGDRQLAALIETRDYTRRIHWWIRLFGVVWLTTIGIGVLVGIALGVSLAINAANNANSGGNGGYANRSECMADRFTTTAQCNALFPNG